MKIRGEKNKVWVLFMVKSFLGMTKPVFCFCFCFFTFNITGGEQVWKDISQKFHKHIPPKLKSRIFDLKKQLYSVGIFLPMFRFRRRTCFLCACVGEISLLLNKSMACWRHRCSWTLVASSRPLAISWALTRFSLQCITGSWNDNRHQFTFIHMCWHHGWMINCCGSTLVQHSDEAWYPLWGTKKVHKKHAKILI